MAQVHGGLCRSCLGAVARSCLKLATGWSAESDMKPFDWARVRWTRGRRWWDEGDR